MKPFEFDPGKYGPVFAGLIDTDKLNDLGTGNFSGNIPPEDPRHYFRHIPIIDEEASRCCVAGLYLHHDLLDPAHRISQTISSSSGSFWHGIMHRREGDFWNSKYWFNRTGQHPVFARLYNAVQHFEEQTILGMQEWDPDKFIDLCERFAGSNSATEHFLRRVQQIEWQLLFDHCYQETVAS